MTNQERALKTFKFDRAKEEAHDAVMKEIMALKKLSHPNIIKLFECYEHNNQFSIVIELCTGGELYDTLLNQGTFSEANASTIIRSLLDALAHCHA